MKNKLIFFCLFFTIALYAQEKKIGHPLRLIMILDSETRTQQTIDSLPVFLAVALAQEAAPIITTGSVLTDFLSRKYQPDLKLLLCRPSKKEKFKRLRSCLERYCELDDEVLHAFSKGDEKNAYGVLLKQWEKLNTNRVLAECIEYYLWSLIPFESDSWLVERGTGENDSLFLLIPRSYVHNAEWKMQRDEWFETLGFNSQAFVAQDFNTLCGAEKFFALFGDFTRRWPIVDLRTCFLKNSGPWHITLFGHGLASSIHDDDGLVAGLSFVQFMDLLRFFNDALQTNFLFYTTCYGGGIARRKLYENLYQHGIKQIRYAIGCGSTTDLPTIGFMLSSMLFPTRAQWCTGFGFPLYGGDKKEVNALLKKVLVPINFQLFFSMLEKAGECVGLPLTWWRRLFYTMVSAPWFDANACVRATPLLKLPHHTDFVPIPLDKRLKIITDQELAQYKQKNRKIIALTDKNGVLVYSAIIVLPIVIRGVNVPQFISMNAEPMIHYFENIWMSNVSVEQFLLSFADPRFAVAADNVFVVKNLVAHTASGILISLQDLVIEQQHDCSSFFLAKMNTHFFKGINVGTHVCFQAIAAAEYYAGCSAIMQRITEIHKEEMYASWAVAHGAVQFENVLKYVCAMTTPDFLRKTIFYHILGIFDEQYPFRIWLENDNLLTGMSIPFK